MSNSIYGEHRPEMERVMNELMEHITQIRKELKIKNGMDPVEHCLCRIKSEESMREKCRRDGIPETPESAVRVIRDGIGIRVVCSFLSDVYTIRNCLREIPDMTVVKEKDFIANAKPNGYRSYHMIMQSEDGYFAEIQLRTISMDTWASLEHHMKYKKALAGKGFGSLRSLCYFFFYYSFNSVICKRNTVFPRKKTQSLQGFRGSLLRS